jgi:tetratricopeptide (TPR) repeat protein
MPFCENCGNKVTETAKFCSNCGGKINLTDASIDQQNIQIKGSIIENVAPDMKILSKDAEEITETDLANQDDYYIYLKNKLDLMEYEALIEECNKAIDLHPDFAGFYSLRGQAKYFLDREREAIDDYDKAIELNQA